MECELLLPQPNRKVEIPRSAFEDNSRAAFIDRIVAKYKTAPASRRYRDVIRKRNGALTVVAGTPSRMTVSVAHHGVRSITFHHFDKGGRS